MGGKSSRLFTFKQAARDFVLWHQDRLGGDAGLGPASGTGFRGYALAQNVRAREDVDTVIAAATTAGGAITRSPAETFDGGYAGYFTDLDGHVWEIA